MNIPNLISLFRLLLIPVFTACCFMKIPNNEIWAAGVFTLSGISDVVDGYIARKYKLITDLGQILDPLADKLMQINVTVCLLIMGAIPWWVLIVLILKETAMLLGGYVLYSDNLKVMSSRWFGKVSTVIFYIVALISILYPHFSPLYQNIMWAIPIATSLYCLIMYFMEFIKKEKKK